MTFEELLDHFESAAQAAGYIVEAEKDWPEDPRRPGKKWPQEPFCAEQARAALARRNVPPCEDYLTLLSRWNGVGLRRPHENMPTLYDYQLISFDQSTEPTDQTWRSCFRGRPNGYEDAWFNEIFYIMHTFQDNYAGLSIATESPTAIFEAGFYGEPPSKEFPSLRSMFQCLTLALEAGVDMCDGYPGREESLPDRLAFAQICWTETRLPTWREGVEFYKEELEREATGGGP